MDKNNYAKRKSNIKSMHDGKYHSHNHVSKLHYYLSTVISKLLKNKHTEKRKKACAIRENTDEFFLEEKNGRQISRNVYKTLTLAEKITKYREQQNSVKMKFLKNYKRGETVCKSSVESQERFHPFLHVKHLHNPSALSVPV